MSVNTSRKRGRSLVNELVDGTVLYHGSYCAVHEPDLAKCAKYKDFGQGFYLTTDIEQARSFAKISLRHALDSGNVNPNQKFGVVSSFLFSRNGEILEKNFPVADVSWLHCVVGHRRKSSFKDVVLECQKYDIIGGKIANDATNLTIAAYMLGAYGAVGSKEADDLCISLLIPERLKNQYCFRTSRSILCLDFQKEERVWL